MYGLNAQDCARQSRGLQRRRRVGQRTLLHKRERNGRKCKHHGQFESRDSQLRSSDPGPVLTDELRVIAGLGVMLLSGRWVLVMTGRLLRLLLGGLSARFQRARRKTLGVEHHQNQRN